MKQTNKQIIHTMVAKDVAKQRKRNEALFRMEVRRALPCVHFLPKQQSSRERFAELMDGNSR